MILTMARRAWIVDSVGAAIFERLVEGLTGSELQSLLLEVTHARALARSPKDLAAQFGRDPFCAPSSVDLRTMLAVDTHLLATAERFEAVELSPVAPMGTCSVVAPTHQHRVLSALRATEVVSDPTNVLALECARRLRTHPELASHLATSHRVVRAQPVPRQPGYAQHFRLFALASAGIERKNHAFTIEAVALHVRTILAGLKRLEEHGFVLGRRRVEILASAQRRPLADQLARLLEAELGPLDHPYYSGGLRYRIWVATPGGEELPLADGVCSSTRSQIVSPGISVTVTLRSPEPAGLLAVSW